MSLLTRAVIAAVAVHEAKQRRPVPIKRDITFFSKYDLWMYDATLDDRTCLICVGHEARPRFFGSELRSTFPYLEIEDDDRIKANVHPHCRCVLVRQLEKEAES